MTQPTILIGIVTYDGHRYAIERLLEAISKLSKLMYHSFSVVFVDNSAGDDYRQFLEGKGFEVIKDDSSETRIDRIIRGRNRLRRICLDRGYDYLFFLDTDVIPPPDAIDHLLRHNKEVVSGIYLGASAYDGKPKIRPVLYAPVSGGDVRTMRIQEVLGDRLIPVAVAGLGCCLIKREIVEKIAFRNIGSSTTGGEDAAFFKDVRALGLTPYADTSVKCFHFSYPEGDQRNELYRFEYYLKQAPAERNYSFTVRFG